jgi:hypothetical protein
MPKLGIRGTFPRLFTVFKEILTKNSINWLKSVITEVPRIRGFGIRRIFEERNPRK